jgi:hypothetical protein
MSEIPRQRVSSSDIAAIGYDEATQTLEIEFHASGLYRYFSVPRAVYEELLRTPTHGKFFHQQIKGRYAWEKASS